MPPSPSKPLSRPSSSSSSALRRVASASTLSTPPRPQPKTPVVTKSPNSSSVISAGLLLATAGGTTTRPVPPPFSPNPPAAMLNKLAFSLSEQNRLRRSTLPPSPLSRRKSGGSVKSKESPSSPTPAAKPAARRPRLKRRRPESSRRSGSSSSASSCGSTRSTSSSQPRHPPVPRLSAAARRGDSPPPIPAVAALRPRTASLQLPPRQLNNITPQRPSFPNSPNGATPVQQFRPGTSSLRTRMATPPKMSFGGGGGSAAASPATPLSSSLSSTPSSRCSTPRSPSVTLSFGMNASDSQVREAVTALHFPSSAASSSAALQQRLLEDDADGGGHSRKDMNSLHGLRIYFEDRSERMRDVIVSTVAQQQLGLEVTKSPADAHVLWSSIKMNMLSRNHLRSLIPNLQRVTSICGMKQTCSKSQFACTFNLYRNLLPPGDTTLDFWPATFVLPFERQQLRTYEQEELKKKSNNKIFFICKPDGGSCGADIFFSDSVEDVLRFCGSRNDGTWIIQRYCQPLLIEKDSATANADDDDERPKKKLFKFDLRVYVLVTSILPLRFHVYREGFCRLAGSPYDPDSLDNAKTRFKNKVAHLTNYAISSASGSADFTENVVGDASDEFSTKRSISTAFAQLQRQHGRSLGFNGDRIWKQIGRCCELTLKVLSPSLAVYDDSASASSGSSQQQQQQQHLLGFDFLVDADCAVKMLEVNTRPNFLADDPTGEIVGAALASHVLRVAAGPAIVARRQHRQQRSPSSPILTTASSVSPRDVVAWEMAQLRESNRLSNGSARRFVAFDEQLMPSSNSSPFDAVRQSCLRARDVFVQAAGGAASRNRLDESLTVAHFTEFAKHFGVLKSNATQQQSVVLFQQFRNASPEKGKMLLLDFVAFLISDLAERLVPVELRQRVPSQGMLLELVVKMLSSA